MIQENRWGEYKTAFFLLMACAVLLMIIFIEWSQLHTYKPAKESGIQRSSQYASWFGTVPDPVEILKMQEEYLVITQRPLFFQGRRPIETSEDQLDNFKGKLELILTGVIVTPEGLSALIRDNRNQSHHLKVGEDIDGWVLDAVYGHKIVIKKDGKRKFVLLRVPRKREKIVAQPAPQPSPIAASKKQQDGLKRNEPK